MTGRFLRRLGRDTRGVSAVEFALIAPVMIMIYFGLVEFCQGYMAQKRNAHVASIVADMVAQNATLTPAQIANVFSVGDKIMRPFGDAELSQRVTNIRRTDPSNKVVWSRATGEFSARGKNSNVDLPPGLAVSNGDAVIMAESEYKYRSLVNFVLPQPITFRHVSYLRPRNADVACAAC